MHYRIRSFLLIWALSLVLSAYAQAGLPRPYATPLQIGDDSAGAVIAGRNYSFSVVDAPPSGAPTLFVGGLEIPATVGQLANGYISIDFVMPTLPTTNFYSAIVTFPNGQTSNATPFYFVSEAPGKAIAFTNVTSPNTAGGWFIAEIDGIATLSPEWELYVAGQLVQDVQNPQDGSLYGSIGVWGIPDKPGRMRRMFLAPPRPAGTYPIEYRHSPVGPVATGTITYTAVPKLDKVEVNRGSHLGGYKAQLKLRNLILDGASTPNPSVTIKIGANIASIVPADEAGHPYTYFPFPITFIVPPGPVGPADVSVALNGVSATFPGAFTYTSTPEITGIETWVKYTDGKPLAGTHSTQIYVFGEGFTPNGTTQVLLDGQAVEDFQVMENGGDPYNPYILILSAGVSTGLRDLTVVNPDGESTTLPDALHVVDEPYVLRGSPPFSPTAGRTFFLEGIGIPDGPIGAFLDGIQATQPNPFEPTSFLAPPHAAGDVDLSIVVNGQTYIAQEKFKYYSGDFEPATNALELLGYSKWSLGVVGVRGRDITDFRVNGASVPFFSNDNGNVFALIPRGTSGDFTVDIVNPAGTTTINNNLALLDPDKTPDNSPPQLSLIGKNPLLLARGTPFTDPGIYATDNYEDNITRTVQTIGSVDTNTVGTYTLQYRAEDSWQNVATLTRTIYVDEIGPTQVQLGNTGGIIARPGVNVNVASGAFTNTTTISLYRENLPPTVQYPEGVSGSIPGTTYTLEGLTDIDELTNLTITIDYPDGDQDGLVDGTNIQELNLVAVAFNPTTNESMTLPTTIDEVANTATFMLVPGVVFSLGAKSADELGFFLSSNSPTVPIGSTASGAIALFMIGAGVRWLRQRR